MRPIRIIMNIHYFRESQRKKVCAKTSGKTHFSQWASLHSQTLLTQYDGPLCFIESHIGEAEILLRFSHRDSIDWLRSYRRAAKIRSIEIANVPFYGENTVAEFAFALLLALSRRIIDADERVRQTGIFSPTGLRGFDLAEKTIGVVGTGHIGAHIIRMAQGFGMTVIAFDTKPNPDLSHILNFKYVSLSELLGTSDIITLHVPYNEQTHHLINRDNIGSIKKGAYLINTARGAVVETQALIEALRSEQIAGAGLDVLEEEGHLADEAAFLTASHPREEELKTVLEDHYLINHPRVIVTPHLAFNTTEAIERILNATIENIQHFSEGTSTNIVTLPS